MPTLYAYWPYGDGWVGKPKLAYLLKRYYNTIDEFRYNEHVPLTETRLAGLGDNITMVTRVAESPP